MVNKMQRFAVQFDSVFMRIRSVYINAVLFIEEALSVFSGASNIDSTVSNEEPTLDNSFDLIKNEVNSLNEEQRTNPSTGLLMIGGVVDTDGNLFGAAGDLHTDGYSTLS